MITWIWQYLIWELFSIVSKWSCPSFVIHCDIQGDVGGVSNLILVLLTRNYCCSTLPRVFPYKGAFACSNGALSFPKCFVKFLCLKIHISISTSVNERELRFCLRNHSGNFISSQNRRVIDTIFQDFEIEIKHSRTNCWSAPVLISMMKASW